MLFHVNTVIAYSAKANKLNLSFINVPGIPEGFTFTLFAPKSVEVTEGQDCDLPKFICNNIWHNQYSYIIKDLIKAAKKSVHHRNEKEEVVKNAITAFDEAEKLNVEKEQPITGEHFGNKGDKVIIELHNLKAVYSYEGTYTGIWAHKPGFDGSYYWTHPSYYKVLWTAEDKDGHVFTFKVGSDKMNSELSYAERDGRPFIMKAEIIGHNTFRFVNQTVLYVRSHKLEFIDEKVTEEVPF